MTSPLPRGLKLKRLEVGVGGKGYRGASQTGELLIQRGFYHAGHVVGVLSVIASASVLGWAWYERVHVAGSFDYGTNPLFWVAGVVLLLYGLLLANRILGKQTIRVAQGQLEVKGGGRDRTIAAGDVVQLFTQHVAVPKDHYRVAVELKDGETAVLVGNLDLPEQARYVEQRIEEVMALEDRPVSGEMPRLAPAAAPRSRIPLAMASLGLFAAVAMMVLVVRGYGRPMGHVEVATTGEPATTALDLDQPGALRVYVDLDLSGPYFDDTAQKRYSLRDMPKTVRLDIGLEQNGKTQRLRCNPFDLFLITNSSSPGDWNVWGPMEDCTLQADAGAATLTAKWTGELGDEVRIDALTLVPMR